MLNTGNRAGIAFFGLAVLISWWTATLAQSNIVCFGRCNGACTCTTNQTYQCADGTCIPLAKYRNGVIDCKDQSDEDIDCCNGHFKCDTMDKGIGKCLENKFVDDGIVQCNDGSDETTTNDKTCTILTAQAFDSSAVVNDFMYKCKTHKYGSKSSKCVKMSWCMDGKFDCPQGDDEDSSVFDRCKVGKFPCGTNADCLPRTNGTFACLCRPGFTGDGVSNCASVLNVTPVG